MLPKLCYCTNLTFPQMWFAEMMQSSESCVCGHLSYLSPQRGVKGSVKSHQVPCKFSHHCHLSIKGATFAGNKQAAQPAKEADRSFQAFQTFSEPSSKPGTGLAEYHKIDVTTTICFPNVSPLGWRSRPLAAYVTCIRNPVSSFIKQR